MIESALASYLAGLAGVVAAFGDGVEPRVVVEVLPTPPQWPAVVVTRISGAPIYTHEVAGVLERARFQVDVLAVGPGSEPAYAALVAAVVAGVSGYRGAWGSFTIGSCLIDAQRNSSSPGDPHRWATSIDLVVLFRAT